MSLQYFAYGSNTDPQRFRKRVGPWISRRRAWLEDHRLRFADSVRSEGGGGAVIDSHAGGRVWGVLFEITAAQLDAMDREEFDPSRDTARSGRRTTVVVQTENGPVEAEVYTVEDGGDWCAPSAAYLGHILTGLRDAGYDERVLEQVRDVAREAGRGR